MKRRVIISMSISITFVVAILLFIAYRSFTVAERTLFSTRWKISSLSSAGDKVLAATWNGEICSGEFTADGDLHVCRRVSDLSPRMQGTAIRPSGDQVVVVSFRDTDDPTNLRVLSWGDLQEQAGRFAHGITTSVQYSPDGGRLFTAGASGEFDMNSQGELCCWDTNSWEPLFRRSDFSSMIQHIAVSRDGKQVAVGTYYGAVLVLRSDTFETICEVAPSASGNDVGGGVMALDFDLNGDRVAVASNGQIYAFDVPSGAVCFQVANCNTGLGVQFIRDSNQIGYLTAEGLTIHDLLIRRDVFKFPIVGAGFFSYNHAQQAAYVATGRSLLQIDIFAK